MDDRLKKVAEYTNHLTEDFLKRQYVIACGVGYKTIKNLTTDEPCVVVSVKRKVHPNSLSPEDIIPAKIDDIRTDVIQTGVIRSHASSRTSAMRPMRPGISIGHPSCTAGTLGCIVVRAGQNYLLSANHVLANLNQGLIGDIILQPGTVDGGKQEDAVAVLSSFVPLRFVDEVLVISPSVNRGCASFLRSDRNLTNLVTNGETTLENFMDAAIALPFDSGNVLPDIVDLGGAPSGQTEAVLGMKVVKSGRTTGLTQGIVLQTHLTIEIEFDGKKARFKDQIMLSGMSQPGDSGALVVDQQRRAVGLLFAGSEEVSVATPIKTILTTFDVKLLTTD